MAAAPLPGAGQVLWNVTGPLTMLYRRNSQYMAKKMSPTLIQFLRAASVGPYWRGDTMTTVPIQNYLSFLDDTNPFYGLTNELTVKEFITLYYLFHDLSDNEINGEIRKAFGDVDGKNGLLNILVADYMTQEGVSDDAGFSDNFAEENEENRRLIVKGIDNFDAAIRMRQTKRAVVR